MLLGDAMDISVPFSEDVLVTDSVTPPSIALNVGDATVTASYYSGSGTNTLIFRYIVESGHTNGSNPITLTPTIDLNDGRIIDRAGNIPIGICLYGAYKFGISDCRCNNADHNIH